MEEFLDAIKFFMGFNFFYVLLSYLIFYLIIFYGCRVIGAVIRNKRIEKNRLYFKNNVTLRDYVNSSSKKELTYKDVSKKELEVFKVEDINDLKMYFYDLFLKFENAYNNLDFEMMKFLSTNQMYENYALGIKLELEKGNKRIIENFNYINCTIYEVMTTNVKQVVNAMIEIEYIDYTLDKNANVIRGDRYKKQHEKFEVSFRNTFTNEEVAKCPTCGAPVKGAKCEYCRNLLPNSSFKISNIKKIIEK